jgi:hypothetical protein
MSAACLGAPTVGGGRQRAVTSDEWLVPKNSGSALGTLHLALPLSALAYGYQKQWRQGFREIGQPLRDLLHGFDAVVLIRLSCK